MSGFFVVLFVFYFLPAILIFFVVRFLVSKLRPTGVLQKEAVALTVATGILLLLAAGYLHFGELAPEMEASNAPYIRSFDGEFGAIVLEGEELRLQNRNTQMAILGIGSAVLFVTTVWWVRQRMRQAPQPQVTINPPVPPAL